MPTRMAETQSEAPGCSDGAGGDAHVLGADAEPELTHEQQLNVWLVRMRLLGTYKADSIAAWGEQLTNETPQEHLNVLSAHVMCCEKDQLT